MEPTITAEEVEILSQEENLISKQESGESLTSEEQSSLQKITSLKEDLKERLKDTDSPQKTKEEIIALHAQKKHFRDKFEKTEAEKKRLEEELAKYKPNPEQKNETDSDDKHWKEKVEFLIQNKDYSKEEFDFISVMAKGRGIPLEEAAKSDETKLFIDALRKKSTKEQGTPSPSSRTQNFVKPESSFKFGESDAEMRRKHAESLDAFKSKKNL